MTRNITISTLGDLPPHENAGTDQPAVDRMIAHWQNRIAQVLPDQPDLIVLPENFDRFGAFLTDPEQFHAFCLTRGDQIRDALAEIAKKHNTWITYPTHAQDAGGAWHNVIQMIDRQGQTAGTYSKNCPTGRA